MNKILLVILMSSFIITQAMENASIDYTPVSLGTLCIQELEASNNWDKLLSNAERRSRLARLNYESQKQILKLWPEWQKRKEMLFSRVKAETSAFTDNCKNFEILNSNAFITQSEDKKIKVWSCLNYECIKEINCQSDNITVFRSQDLILEAINDHRLLIHNLANDNVIEVKLDKKVTLVNPQYFLNYNKNRLITYSKDINNLIFWNIETGQPTSVLNDVIKVTVDNNNNTIAFIFLQNETNYLQIQAIDTDKKLSGIRINDEERIGECLKFGSNNQSIFFETNNYLYNYNFSKKILKQIEWHNFFGDFEAQYSHDGKTLNVFFDNFSVDFLLNFKTQTTLLKWDLETEKVKRTVFKKQAIDINLNNVNNNNNHNHTLAVYDPDLDQVAFAPDSGLIIATSKKKDKSYKLTDIKKMLYLNKGTTLACLTNSGSLQLYDFPLRRELNDLLIEDAHNILQYKKNKEKSLLQNLSQQLQEHIINAHKITSVTNNKNCNVM